MTETKLKPCPFCGGEAKVYIEDKAVSIGCSKCLCGTAWMNGASTTEKKIEVAAQDWNRRITDD